MGIKCRGKQHVRPIVFAAAPELRFGAPLTMILWTLRFFLLKSVDDSSEIANVGSLLNNSMNELQSPPPSGGCFLSTPNSATPVEIEPNQKRRVRIFSAIFG